MSDQTVFFGNSAIHHGKHSDRVYLMHLEDNDFPEILPYLTQLAVSRGYTKIFAKVPIWAQESFQQHGYLPEATVPALYHGKLDACFMSKYLCAERRQEKYPDVVRQALTTALNKQKNAPGKVAALPSPLICRRTSDDDAKAMAELYRQVFTTYPFPIHDPGYLRQTMASHVIYRGIWTGSRLIALASAETDPHGQNAEMTDFATLAEYQGQGLANHLLARLEEDACDSGIRTVFTIARAYSFGMNITFARQGYRFCGTLTHNTQIAGNLESMNVWSKPLATES